MNVSDGQVSVFERDKKFVFFVDENGNIDYSKVPRNQVVQETVGKMRDVIQLHEKIMCSVSGGYDSDILVDLIVRCRGKEKTVFAFNDTGLEYDATKEHLTYLEDKYGIEIKRFKPKKSIPACCREYGVPFWSKRVSQMMYRLQKHGFQWEDGTLEELLAKYDNCKAALRWWCDDWGENSRLNISWVPHLKEFLIAHPPRIPISNICCNKAKKEPSKKEEGNGYDCVVIGVRKKEGGERATSYSSCYDTKSGSADNYRPLFWWSDEDKEFYRKKAGIVRSDCYEVWGMDRTGCVGCPYGKNFEQELELILRFEPRKYKAVQNVFGESYRYTREFLSFRENEKKKRKRAKENENQVSIEGF